MTYDMNDFDAVIDSMPLAITALFLMTNDDERAQFRGILESICARNELRKPWFDEAFRNRQVATARGVGGTGWK